MRKVTFGAASSLDNYIARTDDAVDWLLTCDEAQAIMAGFWKKIDAMIMGRKTYEVALRHAPSSGGNAFGNLKTYVVSRTLDPAEHAARGVEVIAGDPVALLRRLKGEPGKGILIMGGGELANPLLEAGLIDEIGFNVHPVLLGSGVPLFHPMKRQVDLELIEAKPFSNGCVYVMYRLRGEAAA